MTIKLHIISILLLTVPGLASGQTMPDLGDASRFTLFTSVGALTNASDSKVTGVVGSTNTGAYSGFTPDVVLTGTSYVGVPLATSAAADLGDAFDLFNTSTTCGTTLLVTLTGPVTLGKGIYCTGGATTLDGDLILDGDADDVFLFKIGGALSFGSTGRIVLINGASLDNVYFQVDGAVNLADQSVFRGTVVARGAINAFGTSSIYGRAMSTEGALSLNSNVVVGKLEGALPVTLTSFDAKKEGSNAQLTWTTTSETNSDRFEIENSLTGKDWRTAGTVKSHGESKQLLSYTYSAESIGTGINFYRLKMIDTDESFTYSRIRTVEFSGNNRTVMYPNPASDKVALDVDDINMVERIQLNDINGRVYYDQSKTGASNLTASLDVKNFPAGMYVVRITRAAGAITYLKVLKQ